MPDEAVAEIMEYMEPRTAAALSRLPASRHPNELRLRAGQAVGLVTAGVSTFLHPDGVLSAEPNGACTCSAEEIDGVFFRMCRSSVYAYTEQIRAGFVTVRGGHRVGLSGAVATKDGSVTGMRKVTGLAVRFARQYIGCADTVLPAFFSEGSICSGVVVSPPGGGKTTVLRDMARTLSYSGKKVVLVDERGEMSAGDLGPLCDVLDGCPKAAGVVWALRSLSPQVIIVDELGSGDESAALLSGVNAGVPVIISLHASSVCEALSRPQLKPLLEADAIKSLALLDGAASPGRLLCVVKIHNGKAEM